MRVRLGYEPRSVALFFLTESSWLFIYLLWGRMSKKFENQSLKKMLLTKNVINPEFKKKSKAVKWSTVISNF